MDITVLWTFLPQDDPDAAIAFYRDGLGFEVRQDVGNGAKRWITVGSPAQSGTSIVLYPADLGPEPGGAADPAARSMVVLGAPDLDAAFARVRDSGAEVVQEPATQPWGVRDCVFRDPAGNQVRINEAG